MSVHLQRIRLFLTCGPSQPTSNAAQLSFWLTPGASPLTTWMAGVKPKWTQGLVQGHNQLAEPKLVNSFGKLAPGGTYTFEFDFRSPITVNSKVAGKPIPKSVPPGIAFGSLLQVAGFKLGLGMAGAKLEIDDFFLLGEFVQHGGAGQVDDFLGWLLLGAGVEDFKLVVPAGLLAPTVLPTTFPRVLAG